MRISKRTEYALRALSELALHSGRSHLQAQELARREGIPIKFLEQILLALRKAGIVQSRRGVGGGYTLVRSPETITLAEIVELIEGPVLLLDCTGDETEAGVCDNASTCGLCEVMIEVRAAIHEVLEQVTVGQICERTRALRRGAEAASLYSI